MTQIKKHLLTKEVQDNLMKMSEKLSLISNMALVKQIYLNATGMELTKEEFLHVARIMSPFVTALDVDILFLLCESPHTKTGQIKNPDAHGIQPEHYLNLVRKTFADLKAFERPEYRVVGEVIPEGVVRFTVGALAGVVGATAVFPVDVVKTRMQNQRSGRGELMYRSSIDCFGKVIRHEGFGGMYRGLVPQLVGVVPAKAIRLRVNDFVRDKLKKKKKNTMPIWCEVMAGASAGASQVAVTNPVEIVKIRLQVAGEMHIRGKIGGWSVLKELGFSGLYKGSAACFLRDVPFSAIFFPVYAHAKVKFQTDTGHNAPWTLFISGIIAGVPAAGLVTPADVVKTRLQVVPLAGQTSYTGVIDAVRKIWREEGGKAFWSGAGARVIRFAPQFGVTLGAYEVLQRFCDVDFGAR
ncbi:calcium-binding mitochondrial carrier protein Aralar1 [Folsomia candida]|uniref:calcium-binding mitochondrial carrier protein Aralar1 n=1 Tax=Folsomia candida TaxID=158441 RepID=UPI000B900EEA|nr:calcium-binding mitochondrial carrier protein Aralar1 [Folsomia candida]